MTPTIPRTPTTPDHVTDERRPPSRIRSRNGRCTKAARRGTNRASCAVGRCGSARRPHGCTSSIRPPTAPGGTSAVTSRRSCSAMGVASSTISSTPEGAQAPARQTAPGAQSPQVPPQPSSPQSWPAQSGAQTMHCPATQARSSAQAQSTAQVAQLSAAAASQRPSPQQAPQSAGQVSQRSSAPQRPSPQPAPPAERTRRRPKVRPRLSGTKSPRRAARHCSARSSKLPPRRARVKSTMRHSLHHSRTLPCTSPPALAAYQSTRARSAAAGPDQ